MMTEPRLAIVTSHPIQYFSPWFRWIHGNVPAKLKVFYLDNPAQRSDADPEFGHQVSWNVPLLEGFDSQFVPNRSAEPGTHHFGGLHNPELWGQVNEFRPNATLLMVYRYRSILPRMLRGRLPPNTWLRGDSHLLNRKPGAARWLADRIIRRAFRSLSGALFVGQHNQEYFKHYGLGSHQLLPSPPAVDGAHYRLTPNIQQQAAQWRRDQSIPETDRVLLFVGKLVERKRPLMLLKAFVDADLSDATLVFVGSGEEAEAISALAQNQQKVRLLNFQNQQAMPVIYAATNLLILPSVVETWGLVVNEAQLMGVPALVSDLVGCGPDLVGKPGCGLVFKADSQSALCDALGEALSDNQRLDKWGQASLALAQQRSSFPAMAQSLPMLLGAGDGQSPATDRARQGGDDSTGDQFSQSGKHS